METTIKGLGGLGFSEGLGETHWDYRGSHRDI